MSFVGLSQSADFATKVSENDFPGLKLATIVIAVNAN